MFLKVNFEFSKSEFINSPQEFICQQLIWAMTENKWYDKY